LSHTFFLWDSATFWLWLVVLWNHLGAFHDVPGGWIERLRNYSFADSSMSQWPDQSWNEPQLDSSMEITNGFSRPRGVGRELNISLEAACNTTCFGLSRSLSHCETGINNDVLMVGGLSVVR
jgi:hypothetical protein